MIEGSVTLQVNRPAAHVFPIVADLEQAPKWVPDLVSVTKLTDGPIRVGTQYSEVVKMGNKQAPADLEVTEYEPDRAFAHRGRGGPSRFTGRFVVEPDGEGCRIVHDWTVQMTGFARLFEPFAGKWIRKNTEAGLANLKALLEGG